MNYLAQIQRGIDYIEANLEAEVEAADVARHAGISHWHFQRIFKALTNETLKTYIRSRRLASSLDKLATTDERVLDIALAAGFESQEAFTRAFKKAFGLTPGSYRRRGQRFQFLRKLRFDEAYLRHLHGNLTLEPELYDQRALRLVGLSTRFYSVDSEKNNLGTKLPALWQAFLARLPEVPRAVPGLCYGVVQQTAERTDELEYHAAIEVEASPDRPLDRPGRPDRPDLPDRPDRLPDLPPGMVLLHLPAARYARFAHRGNVAHVDRTVNYIYSSWLARSQLRHTYAADLELYDARYHPTSDDSVMHYAIPVQPSPDDPAR